MATVTDFFPSQYLRCADLNGAEVVATIDHVKTDVSKTTAASRASLWSTSERKH